ncbi:MAG: DNA-directed RNA polymerase subunit A', partial [Methanobrevibacter sp.]|nr:DNA-directed RNA polymerase subunit A' [Methanobrevibacter sp.]
MKEIIKKIDHINFGLMSPENIRKNSVIKIVTPDTYDEDGYPIENGLMDPHLGVIDPSLKCKTCGSKGGECLGHFGSIDLARPVVHVGFADNIYKILRSVCNECGRILLTDTEIENFKHEILLAMDNEESINEIIKRVQDASKKDKCPH